MPSRRHTTVCFAFLDHPWLRPRTTGDDNRMHRIMIRHQGVLLGHFDSAPTCTHERLRHVLATVRDLQCEATVLESVGERRLLESTPDGLRVVAAEPLFRARRDPRRRAG